MVSSLKDYEWDHFFALMERIIVDEANWDRTRTWEEKRDEVKEKSKGKVTEGFLEEFTSWFNEGAN